MTKPLPAVFFGHGNPLNALARNAWTDGWAAIGKEIPRPRAVLCVSAHWYLPATLVMGSPAPRTIHDFGGFPKRGHKEVVPKEKLKSHIKCEQCGADRPTVSEFHGSRSRLRRRSRDDHGRRRFRGVRRMWADRRAG